MAYWNDTEGIKPFICPVETFTSSPEQSLSYFYGNIACPSTSSKSFWFLCQKHDAFLWYEYRTLFWPVPGRSEAQIFKFLKAEVLSLCLWTLLSGGVLVSQPLSEDERFVREITRMHCAIVKKESIYLFPVKWGAPLQSDLTDTSKPWGS